MRRYEQIYILQPSLNEDAINTVIENTNQIIKDTKGSIIFLDKWGMKKLAYPIKKESQGFYVFCDFAATPEAVAEIERKFRIDDAILKYLSVKIADAISEEEIAAAQEAAVTKPSYSKHEDDDDESHNNGRSRSRQMHTDQDDEDNE